MEKTYNLVIKNQTDNFNNFINNIDYEQVLSLTNVLLQNKEKNIHVLGIGKSSSLAIYFSDILKSLNLKSFYLNCVNLTHGDSGCIKKDDLVIIVTKSGNTEEILKIIDIIPCFKVLITCNNKSNLSSFVDQTFIIPFKYEADLFFNIIPSNSSLNFIAYLNFVINIYVERSNFNFDNYKQSHPSGDIGFKTKKIEDFTNNDIYICSNFYLSNNEVIKILLDSKNGIVFEKNNKFYGILTTKDVLSNLDLLHNKSIYDLINKTPIVFEDASELMIDKIDLVKRFKLFKFIPVLKNKKCIGILDNSSLINKIK